MAIYVSQGETINQIAERAGVTREYLLAMNPDLAQYFAPGTPRPPAGSEIRLGRGVFPDGDNWSQSNFFWYTHNPSRANIPNPQVEGYKFSPLGAGIPTGDTTTTRDPLPGVDDRDPSTGGGGVPDSGGVPGPGTASPGPDSPAENPPVPAGPTEGEIQNAIDNMRGSFPELWSLGLGDLITSLVRERPDITPMALLGEVRDSDIWRDMFPNIRRDDGTLRMNEATYLSTLDNYRRTLNRFGLGHDYSNAELSNFLANEIDVNELDQRLTIYDRVMRGGEDLRNIFYVFGGLNPSDDDLYRAVVDPDTASSMISEYYTGTQGLDYNTFIARTVDVVTANTGEYVDRAEAAALVDQLHHGGDPWGGNYLSLAELTRAFEAAMLGSAATSQGLLLPSLDRIEEFRLAGINRSQALQQYGEFARDRNFLNAIVERARGGTFDQADFESATFLSDPDQQRRLTAGLAQEAARKRGGGSFGFTQDRGRLAQAGMSAFRS